MSTTIGSTFLQLADAAARAERIAYPLAELNDLLAAGSRSCCGHSWGIASNSPCTWKLAKSQSKS
jgi:hypothetical protein